MGWLEWPRRVGDTGKCTRRTRLLAGRTLWSLIPPLPQTPLICSTDVCPQRRAWLCRQRVFKKSSHRGEDHHRDTQVRGTVAGVALRFSIYSSFCRCGGISSTSPGVEMSCLIVICWGRSFAEGLCLARSAAVLHGHWLESRWLCGWVLWQHDNEIRLEEDMVWYSSVVWGMSVGMKKVQQQKRDEGWSDREGDWKCFSKYLAWVFLVLLLLIFILFIFCPGPFHRTFSQHFIHKSCFHPSHKHLAAF